MLHPRLSPSFASFVLAALLLAIPPRALATVEAQSTEALTRSASVVVIGRVERVECRFTAGHAAIVSLASVVIEEALKGTHPRRRIVVETLGGEIGRVGMRATDAARLQTGQRVLLFLTPAGTREGHRVHEIVGQAQGAFRLENGVARKDPVCAIGNTEVIDWEIAVDDLLAKIRKAR
jgi:hypothetical protein